MTRFVSIAALAASIVAVASTASAQIVVTNGPAVDIDIITTSAGPVTFNEAPGGEFTGTTTLTGDSLTGQLGFRVAGDGSLPVPVGASTTVLVTGTVALEVGPLPVEVSTGVAVNAKIVNSGGTLADPFTNASITSSLGEVRGGSFPDYSTTNILFNSLFSDSITGNGLTIFDGTNGTPTYILAPNVTYALQLQYQLNVDAGGLTSADPSAAVVLEAGGISGFDGLVGVLNYRAVPEPTSLGVAAISLLALRRRR